MFRNSHIT